MGSEPDRVLHLDESAATEGLAQAVVEEVDGGGVAMADRSHHGNLALEQFDAIVFGEDPGGCHTMEVVDREAVAGSGRGHAHSPRYSSAARRPAPAT